MDFFWVMFILCDIFRGLSSSVVVVESMEMMGVSRLIIGINVNKEEIIWLVVKMNLCVVRLMLRGRLRYILELCELGNIRLLIVNCF